MVERYQVGTSAQGHIIAAPSVNGKWVTYEACAKLVAALKAFVEEWDEFAMNQLADCYQQACEALREIGE